MSKKDLKSRKSRSKRGSGAIASLAKRVLPVYGRMMPEPGGDPNWKPTKEPRIALWKRIRFIRRTIYTIQYMIPCIRVTFFSIDGFYSKAGRTLIAGKFRRMFLSFFPSYAHKLQQKYGLSGGCRSCGASCNLLLQCPHWDTKSHLCSIYDDRPPACRLFPITPADVRDRDLVLKKEPCGFAFQTPPIRVDRHVTLRPQRGRKRIGKRPIPIPPKH